MRVEVCLPSLWPLFDTPGPLLRGPSLGHHLSHALCPLNPRCVFWTSWWSSDSRPRGQSAWAACSSTRTQRSLRARNARWKPVPVSPYLVVTTLLLGIKRRRPIIESSEAGVPWKGLQHIAHHLHHLAMKSIGRDLLFSWCLLLNMPATGGDWKVPRTC